jgi:hypothetical protein
VDNVIDFQAYRQFRLDMEEEMIKEDVLDFLLNSSEYKPSTFTFTLNLDDDNE